MKSYLIPVSQAPEVEVFTLCLEEFAIIGNSINCSHNVKNEEFSERQFRIEYRQGHHWIRDLRSGQATYVNDFAIQESPLAEGDIIRVGRTEYRFTKSSQKTKLNLTSANAMWASDLNRIAHAANTDFPILILGPSGAGKDILSQAIHKGSSRSNGPCISVNCSALTESLVESELFGHIKGSFTGAISDRKGAFESARGGTLFLDEIGDLPLSMQAKLLRALENGEIRPVGADNTVKTNVRIIAATHQNLLEKIRDGKFRVDLYYRLNVVTVNQPALAARMEDFDQFISMFSKDYKVRFSINALHRLRLHTWPGNIRELKNFVARSSALYPGLRIEENMIPQLIDTVEPVPQMQGTQTDNLVPMPIIKEIEKQMILKRLVANRGNQRRTANELGMPKSTLHDRLKNYQINPKDFRV